jgi:homocysteine S-methyltransferase
MIMDKPSNRLNRLGDGLVTDSGPAADRLAALGAEVSPLAALLNLTRPDLVRRVHQEYADAGAGLLNTNTADANMFVLRRRGLEAKMSALNEAGVRLALECAGRQTLVAGVVGPLGLTIEEDWDLDSIAEAYRSQIQALLDAGVHAIRLEAFANLAELRFAVGQARAAAGAGIPVMALMTFNDGGCVESGENAATVARTLGEAGADVIGACGGRGLAVTARAVEELLKAAPDRPVCAGLNAGFPETEAGRLVYLASPDYIAETAMRLARAGARILGAYAGTTPEMVRAISLALTTVRAKAAASAVAPAAVTVGPFPGPVSPAPPKDGAFLRGLRHALPVIAEMDPPGHLQYAPLIEDARVLIEAGADAISMAENPLASLKMSNIALAAIIRRETGARTICHITCRDRNLLGMQSAVMGAHALGIESILALTGDPLAPVAGAGRSVFDLNSFTLVRLLAGMNRGLTQAGTSLKGETDFSIGVAFNANARNLANEEQRLARKAAEGARFIMTQPVFDPVHARRILELTGRHGVRVFLGFFPLVSARTALYLHNEVPGIRIPEQVLQRLNSLPDKNDQEKAGLEMTVNLMNDLQQELDGVYLISPHNRPRLLAPLIRMIRAWPRGAADKAEEIGGGQMVARHGGQASDAPTKLYP